MGIEPTPSAWKAEVLPLNYTRWVNNRAPILSHLVTDDCAPSRRLLWWRGEDLNLRRLSRQIYSLIPLTTREPLRQARHSPSATDECQYILMRENPAPILAKLVSPALRHPQSHFRGPLLLAQQKITASLFRDKIRRLNVSVNFSWG